MRLSLYIVPFMLTLLLFSAVAIAQGIERSTTGYDLFAPHAVTVNAKTVALDS